jgi:hypothetical protein
LDLLREIARCGVLSLQLRQESLSRNFPIFPHRIALTQSFPHALRDERSPLSPESLSRSSKSILGINALNLPAAKLFQSTLGFRKPQRFGIGLDFIVNSGNQTLCKLNAIPQREFHSISCELI